MGTVIIAIIVFGIIGAVVAKLIYDKLHGKSSCSYCDGCDCHCSGQKDCSAHKKS